MVGNYIVIPAKANSNRLPGKLLFNVCGKPLIQHTWENCIQVKDISGVFIASSDEKILRACESFGANIIYIPEATRTGTDCVVAASKKIEGKNNIVNVQGEWAMFNPLDINILIRSLYRDNKPLVSSLFYRAKRNCYSKKPSFVKVVLKDNDPDLDGFDALYFSRCRIPHKSSNFNCHVGIYAFNHAFCDKYKQIKIPDIISLSSENLEQLEWLQRNIPIKMFEAHRSNSGYNPFGVDTRRDFRRYVKMYKEINGYKRSFWESLYFWEWSD